MSLTARFGEYAAAFEKAYDSDDWKPIGAFFTEAATYEPGIEALLGGRVEGRAGIVDNFKRVLDQFDRRFESRALKLLEGPRESADSLWIRGSATYTAPGLPDLVFELEETAVFEGDRICELRDEYTPEMEQAILDYAARYGEELGIEGSSRS